MSSSCRERKVNESQQNGGETDTRKWKRRFVARWFQGEYVAATHLAEEHGMEESEVNKLIKTCQATGL